MTLDCVALGLGAGTDMICQDFSGEVSFEAGRLVSLKIVISQDLSVAYPDIVSKFGQPNGWDQDKTLGIWSTDEFHVFAVQVDQDTAIAWMTTSKYLQTAKTQRGIVAADQKSMGNSLD